MKPNGYYRRWYRIARFFVGIFYRLDISGRENIPAGAAMVCANHSSRIDPFLAAFAFGLGHHVHFIAKVSLFKVPVLSGILKKLGMISVDRSLTDVSTIKSTLKYLKNGEKVAIFPEGRRAAAEGDVLAKSGAVKLAVRAGVPLVPVFIPRKKPLFHKIPVIIGKPYSIEKRDGEVLDYALLSEELMTAIESLDPTAREKL